MVTLEATVAGAAWGYDEPTRERLAGMLWRFQMEETRNRRYAQLDRDPEPGSHMGAARGGHEQRAENRACRAQIRSAAHRAAVKAIKTAAGG